MSLKTLPLLFINLGGEMLYILDQRLKAQSIADGKANKVKHDIIGTMLHKRFMEELFKPQEMYSKKAMRMVFDRLAHASIMRLNPASMDKLYDLMTMAFKYQISLALRPKDLLLITFNHMDEMRNYVKGNEKLEEQVKSVYMLYISHYASLHSGECMLIRQTLLHFFQDNHIKVSIFLKDKTQGNNGRFILPQKPHVPFGSQVPGTIKLFDDGGKEIKTEKFPAAPFEKAEAEGSFELTGDRVTILGTNMYAILAQQALLDNSATDVSAPAGPAPAPPAPAAVTETKAASTSLSAAPAVPAGASSHSICSIDPDNPAYDASAKEQLDLLSKLIGGTNQKQGSKENIMLNLFGTTEEEEEAALLRRPNRNASQIVMFDGSSRKENQTLAKVIGEMSVDEGGDETEADLLDLMDAAKS